MSIGGTNITIIGSGFYNGIYNPSFKTSFASCRFGQSLVGLANGAFSTSAWVPAVVANSSYMYCVAPSSSTANAANEGYTEIQARFIFKVTYSEPLSLSIFLS